MKAAPVSGWSAWLSRALALPLIGLVKLYRLLLSPLIGQHCRYTPTCSQYALEALAIYGPFKGSYLTLARLARCHPWCEAGYDPVPPPVQAVPAATTRADVFDERCVGQPVVRPSVRPSVRQAVRGSARGALALSIVLHLLILAALVFIGTQAPDFVGKQITQIALHSGEKKQAVPVSAAAAIDERAAAVAMPLEIAPAAVQPLLPVETTEKATSKPLDAPPSSVPDRDVPASPGDAATKPRVDAAAVVGQPTLADMQRAYFAILRRHVDQQVLFPAQAGTLAVQRRAMIAFTLDRSGHVLESRVRASSGLPLFDAAALAVVQRSSPFPPMPSSLPYQVLELDLPVDSPIF